MQDRQRPVAPAAGGLRLVHLELVVELEQLAHPLAVEDEPVQRGQQRGAPHERLAQTVELVRVDLPRPAHTLHDGHLAHRTDIVRLTRSLHGLGASHPECGQPAPSPLGQRLVDGHGRRLREDPTRQVPLPLAPLAADHGNLAARFHEVEHPLGVLVVGPPGRTPRHDAGVRQPPSRQRCLGLELFEDVEAAVVVRRHPLGDVHLPVVQRLRTRPLGHLGAVERDVLGRPQEAPQLDHRPLLEQLVEVTHRVGAAQTAPAHQVGARARRRP